MPRRRRRRRRLHQQRLQRRRIGDEHLLRQRRDALRRRRQIQRLSRQRHERRGLVRVEDDLLPRRRRRRDGRVREAQLLRVRVVRGHVLPLLAPRAHAWRPLSARRHEAQRLRRGGLRRVALHGRTSGARAAARRRVVTRVAVGGVGVVDGVLRAAAPAAPAAVVLTGRGVRLVVRRARTVVLVRRVRARPPRGATAAPCNTQRQV